MTYYVSSGTLNPTHSLTHSPFKLLNWSCQEWPIGSWYICISTICDTMWAAYGESHSATCSVNTAILFMFLISPDTSNAIQYHRNCDSLLTPLTRTRPDCLVLSCPYWQCEHDWRQDKIILSCPYQRCEHKSRQQDKTILFCLNPVSNLKVCSSPQCIWDWTVAKWKLGREKTKLVLDTESRQDKTV